MRRLRVALISTDYPPLKTSTAVMMDDLAHAFVAQGHEPVMLAPSWSTLEATEENHEGVIVLRLPAPEMRQPSYIRRVLAEMWMPFSMWRQLRKTRFAHAEWDLVAWINPSIFFGPLIWAMTRHRRTRVYMILRDIFPDWALDLGLLKKGPVYYFFKAVANLQYPLADAVGVQSESNLKNLPTRVLTSGKRVEVLWNWIAADVEIPCSIDVGKSGLSGRKIFVYTGNMGVAQGMDIVIEMVTRLRDDTRIGFVFVGRGTEFEVLRKHCVDQGLANILFFPEIDPREIPGLLAQCHVGIVALHTAHNTHNIPGKFLSYVRYGLPVLARVASDSDLARLIKSSDVGKVFDGDSADDFQRVVQVLAVDDSALARMSENGKKLADTLFSPAVAVQQLTRIVPQ